MINKNPYENQNEDTLDIPDFVEEKQTDSNSIDFSIFKMSDDELYDDNDEDDPKEYREKEVKSAKSTSLIICIAIICVLLVASIASIFYAMKQHEAYVKANTNYLQLQAKEDSYKKQLEEKDATIAELNRQLEEKQSNTPSPSDTSGNTGGIDYIVVDGPLHFFLSPSNDADYTTYNGKQTLENGEHFSVISVVDDADNNDNFYWVKLADNVYVRTGMDDSIWAKKAN